jgi:CheY-like chemotaxis protein
MDRVSQPYAGLAILLLEADDERALDLAATLQRLGVDEVLHAPSVEEAEAALASGRIDLAVIDLTFRGAELLVLELPAKRVGVVGLAGHGAQMEPGDRVPVLRLPFTEAEIVAAIAAALAAAADGMDRN